MIDAIKINILNSQKFKTALKCDKVEGLQGALKSFFVTCLAKKYKKILVITNEPDELSDDIRNWVGTPPNGHHHWNQNSTQVYCIPVWNDGGELLGENEPPVEIKSEVLFGLSVLLDNESQGGDDHSSIVVSGPLMTALPFPDELRNRSLKLKVKSEKLDLINKLAEIGFTRVGTVEDIGEFAVRGGIIDLWGYGMKNPVRVEFLGDKIDSIREFDPLLQTSIKYLNAVTVLPINLKPGEASIMDYISGNELVILDGIQEPKDKKQEAKFVYLGEGYNVGSLSSYQGDIRMFRETIEKLNDYSIFIICENETEKSRILKLLTKGVDVIIGKLGSGFILPDAMLAVFSYSDIFGHKMKVSVHHPFKGEGIRVDDLTSLHPDDFVVHIDYGIGIYRGLKRLKFPIPSPSPNPQYCEIDCLFIEYKGGDKLYVPVNKFHLVEKWVGSYEQPPELTLLDSGSWERKKSRAKKYIQDMTQELLSLYAERKLACGYKFSADTVWQAELESKFPYEETEGQLKVIEEVKRDMESEFPMDRLICGEVGYGKTEIALRASFKAVMDGKQVAFLCPTTILVEQHFRTFKARLADFPVVVEHLSRFRNKAEQKRIISSLREGTIDIVIGTHRLLSNDIKFKDLGLVIIDEEHRFGVAQKEKLRKLKKNVDTLSLTATPIPRTLYMSLTKIKDISKLDTPPCGRQPIVTQVAQWDDDLIERAISYEIERGGQVYFVHNRIDGDDHSPSIDAIASKIRSMNPGFNVGVAHAELSERDLETVMLKFLCGDINVLVTTAIIGSGIDIPRVNTIIINHADRFGLSELHQLRGRVGRSDKKAFCYLLVPRSLTPEAKKRIQAIITHTELGAGFKLALRDLEIRGVGNLLGREQHGHIHAVGYELYIQLLEEEIKKIKGEKVVERIEPEIRLGVSCYIPDWYADTERKLSLYKRLASCETLSQIDEFEHELIDRFGVPPEPVKHLLIGARIKLLAKERKILKVQRSTLHIDYVRGKTQIYEFVFKKMPKKLWFSKKYIEYVKPVNEGIAIGVKIRRLEELKNLLQ